MTTKTKPLTKADLYALFNLANSIKNTSVLPKVLRASLIANIKFDIASTLQEQFELELIDSLLQHDPEAVRYIEYITEFVNS